MKAHHLILPLVYIAILAACNKAEDSQGTLPEDEKKPDDTEVQVSYIQLNRAEMNVASSANDFGVTLFQLLSEKTDEDLLLSPLSLSLDLTLCSGGAQGETQEEILTTLGFKGYQVEDVASYYKKMVNGLVTLDPSVTFQSANSIWTDIDYPISDSYSEYAKEYFDADLSSLNLGLKESLKEINEWCEEETNGMIKKVLDDSKDPDNKAVSYLLNAIYYNGGWRLPFDETIEDGPFHGSKGESEVPYLTAEHNYPYHETETAQFVSLPLGGGAFSLILAVPHVGETVGTVLAAMRASDFFFYSRVDPVTVRVPKFSMDKTLAEDLKDALMQLGINHAFQMKTADFFNMFSLAPPPGERFFIDIIRQVSRFQLDEHGAEAASVTIIGMDVSSLGEEITPTPRTVVADHPFLFALVENTSRTILFLGQKVN